MDRAVSARAQRLYAEVSLQGVSSSHDWRRRRNNEMTAALADPINMPVAMHDDGPARQRANAAQEPISIDESGAKALGKSVRPLGVLDHVVVQRNHPRGSRILAHGDFEAVNLLRRNESEGIREGEMSVCVRVQEDDAQASVRFRRQHHREHAGPQLGHSSQDHVRAALISEPG